MELFKFIEFLVVLSLLLQLLLTIYRYGLKMDIHWVSYYVFVVFFVLPDFIFLLNGSLNLHLYYGWRFIDNNFEVDAIYIIIVAIINYCLLKSAKKSVTNCSSFVGRFQKLDYVRLSSYSQILFFVLTLAPFFAAFFSPDPALYFFSFAPFYRFANYSISLQAVEWHSSVMSYAMYAGFIGIIALWLESEETVGRKRTFIMRSYLFFVAIQILLFSNKRTLGLMLLAVLVIIDAMYKKKTPWLEIVALIVGGGSFFVFYQIVSGKPIAGGVAGGWVEHYALYFSREIDLKLVIYSLLHPDELMILDYPGQSLVFDILAFIPRNIWPNKPLPFGDYLSGAWKHVAASVVDSRNLTSFFAEMIANLSWIGLPLSIWLYLKMISFFSKIQNPIVYTYAIFVSIYFMVTMIGSNHFFMLVLFILYLLLEKKRKYVITVNGKRLL